MMNNLIHQYEHALELFTHYHDFDKAIKEYKKVIKIDKNFAQAYYDLGYIYNLKNNLKNSNKYFQKYLKLKPNTLDKQVIIEMMNNQFI